MLHDILYKRDSKGNIRTWRLEQDGFTYRTLSGVEGGTEVASGWTTCTAKNVGRANETNPVDQAVAEIVAEYEKKLKRGYARSVEELDQLTIFKPMLAKEWSGEVGYMQPKLDGMRCIARADGLWSRTGQKITSVPHIFESLTVFFDNDPDLILDGELYNHKFRDNFPKLMSLCRKQKPTAEEMAETKAAIQYHIYDVPSIDDVFIKRWEWLASQGPAHPTVLVDTRKVETLEALETIYARYLELGYEGGIVRLNEPYENKRSKNLLKRKDFKDDEFEIVELQEGNGNFTGCAKIAILLLPDGRTFGAGVAGAQSMLRDLLRDKDAYKGKRATVRYFTESPDGIPRFPVVKALHKEDRW